MSDLPPEAWNSKWSGYSAYWLGWLVLGFGIPEALAIRADKKARDHVARTLSSNTRKFTGYDSITGRRVDVRYGKLRRLAFITFMAWFTDHIKLKNNNDREV